MMITITVRLDDRTIRALEAAAQHEDRKPRALARLIVNEGLKRRGYLLTEHGDDRHTTGGQGDKA